MKKRFMTVWASLMAVMMLCSCGAKEISQFKLVHEKGESGYTCYGFREVNDPTENLVIPGEFDSKPVINIGEHAFSENEKIKTLVLSEGIELVDMGAFAHCTSLEEVALPETLKELDYWAFKDCESLKAIYIPEGVTEIGQGAFEECTSLEIAIIDGKIDSVPHSAFNYCPNLRAVYLPETVREIYMFAFYDCDWLEEIHFAGTADEFLNIELNMDWISAKDVLVCCLDRNIVFKNKNTWSETDRQPSFDFNTDVFNPNTEEEDWSDEVPDTEEDWSDLAPDETMSSDGSIPEGFVEFTPMFGTVADAFAYEIINCNFDAAGKYVADEYLNAIGGNVKNKFSDYTLEHLSTGPIGMNPELYYYSSADTRDEKEWQSVIDLIERKHSEVGVSMDFDSGFVESFTYVFGKTEDRDYYANLQMYTYNNEIIYFAYLITN